MTSLKLRTKLLLLAGSGLLTSLLIAGTSEWGLHGVSASETLLAEDAVPSLQVVARVNDALGSAREQLLTALLTADPAEREAAIKGARKQRAMVPDLLNEYQSHIDNAVERKLYDETQAR